jgi:hypothetical protein
LLGIGSRERAAARVECRRSPPYQLLRYDEDYRYLSEPGARSDLWDPIKFIPLGSDSGHWLSLGGELRERFEYYSAPTFGIQGQSPNGYLLHRLVLNVDSHFGDNARKRTVNTVFRA